MKVIYKVKAESFSKNSLQNAHAELEISFEQALYNGVKPTALHPNYRL